MCLSESVVDTDVSESGSDIVCLGVTVGGSKAAEDCHVEATDCSVDSPATSVFLNCFVF